MFNADQIIAVFLSIHYLDTDSCMKQRIPIHIGFILL